MCNTLHHRVVWENYDLLHNLTFNHNFRLCGFSHFPIELFIGRFIKLSSLDWGFVENVFSFFFSFLSRRQSVFSITEKACSKTCVI